MLVEMGKLAVTCWLYSKPQSCQSIAYSGLKNTLVDRYNISGQNSFIIKCKTGYISYTSRTFMHGNKIGSNSLVNVICSESSFLNEHIHLNAVTECLVSDKSRNVGSSDDLVLSGNHVLRTKAVLKFLETLIDEVSESVKDFRTFSVRNSVDSLIAITITVTDHVHETF